MPHGKDLSIICESERTTSFRTVTLGDIKAAHSTHGTAMVNLEDSTTV